MCRCLLKTASVKGVGSQNSRYDYTIKPDGKKLYPYFSL